jgi:hypothetical protein
MCFEPSTSRQMLATMRVQADDALSRPIRHGEKKAMRATLSIFMAP